MAEDLKVSEFESGTDRRMYHTHRNLQQVHGPEANFHYRAESADEILGDLNKLRNMILDHYRIQCPRLAALDDYMKARNDGIYNDEWIIGQPIILPRSSMFLMWGIILGFRSRKPVTMSGSMSLSGSMTGGMILKLWTVSCGGISGNMDGRMSCSTGTRMTRIVLSSAMCLKRLSAMDWMWRGRRFLRSDIRSIGRERRSGQG